MSTHTLADPMIRIDWTTEAATPADNQLLAVPLTSSFKPDDLEARFGRAIRNALEASPFQGEPEDRFSFTQADGEAMHRVLLFGVGETLASVDSALRIGHDAVREAHGSGCNSLLLDLRGLALNGTPFEGQPLKFGSTITHGLMLGTYGYNRFLSDAKPNRVEAVTVLSDDAAASEGVERGRILSQGVALARDLGNGPGGLVTPSFLADTAGELVEALAADHDVALNVLERDDCEKLGMGCYLGVAQGAGEPPKFIHLTYKPKGEAKGRVALIGKGVTFDSGGYSLKPTAGMLDMKMDMCGAAAVLGGFKALVERGVPWEVHVIVAATENMIGPKAYRLGDVLQASNGKTVEINNTDAEGRLTMADAMVYASKLEPDLVLDFATLTGASMVALGRRIAAVMSPDDTLAQEWMAAAERSGESMWRLPLPAHLKESLKSQVADMRNAGDRYGGAITAGLFLKEFTEGKRWLHVDLAGPSMAPKPFGTTTAGATGFAVSTILEFLEGDVTIE